MASETWQVRSLQSLMRKPIQYGIVQTGNHVSDGIPCVRVVDITKPDVNLSEMARVSPAIHERYRKTTLQVDDVLFALRGDIGTAFRAPALLAGANIHRGVARLATDPTLLAPRFLVQALQSTGVVRDIVKRTNGSALRELPIAQLRRLCVPVPPLPEQAEIARILEGWTSAVFIAHQLLAAKRRFKRGLVQVLMTGGRRFKQCEGNPRQSYRLGDLLTESRVASSDGRNARRLTVRLYGKGVVRAADRQPGSQRTKYYRRSAGQFIYSKLDFLNGACGVVPAVLDGFDPTLDIPAFDVSSEVDVRWLAAMVSERSFHVRHVGLTVGGRKAKRMNPRQLLGIQMALPSKAEQTAIADVLELLEEELSLLTKLRAALDRQRRGVAELLLTGKVRIPA